MKSVSVKFSPKVTRWLNRRARQLRRTRSDLIREALDEEWRRFCGPSCHDLMKPLCGTLDGPPDLSTNPKYMEGFGE